MVREGEWLSEKKKEKAETQCQKLFEGKSDWAIINNWERLGEKRLADLVGMSE